MQNCMYCTNAIHDIVWGEYKCKEKKHVIYPEEFKENCPFYTAGMPTISKGKDKPFDEE